MKLLSVVIISLFATAALAAPAKIGLCVACHGKDGKGMTDLYPNLCAQKKGYLAKQLTDFKKGDRKDASMKAMVASLSDKDIKELAEHYSKQKPCK